MKILIRGAGFENKGAEAMLRVTQRELSRRIPAAIFHATVLPLEAPFAYRSGITPLFYAPSTRVQILRMLPIISKIPEFLLSKKNPDFAKAIKTNTNAAYEINAIGSVDAVVDVSGFSYSDNWGTGGFRYAWPWLEYCHSKQKPYIFLPQAWGPFEKKDVAHWAKKLCQAADLIVSRDDVSSKYLARLPGYPETEVRQAPDIAFCFQGAPSTLGGAILNDLGLKRDRPVIGIVPNMRVYERTEGTGAGNRYVKLLVALVDHCIEILGADVLLAPNEIKLPGTPGPDDRFLCGVVATHTRETGHCFTLRNYHYSEAVKSLLGQVDLLIASRFHSLVFALSQRVPVLALGWSHKYHELLRPFGLENFVVDHDQMDTASVISLVETAWQQRETTVVRIRETVPQLKTQVAALFDEIAAMIRERSG